MESRTKWFLDRLWTKISTNWTPRSYRAFHRCPDRSKTLSMLCNATTRSCSREMSLPRSCCEPTWITNDQKKSMPSVYDRTRTSLRCTTTFNARADRHESIRRPYWPVWATYSCDRGLDHVLLG